MNPLSDQSDSAADRAHLAHLSRRAKALTLENRRLREALREIRDADPVDMALDPNWPARIAKAAFDEEAQR